MPSTEANAAVFFRQAVAALPEWTRAEQRLLLRAQTAPLNRTAVGLLQKGSPALQQWQRGAVLPQCDWGLDFSPSGFDQLLDLFGKVDRLTKLVSLRIRFLFQENSLAEAVAAIAALILTSRHIGRSGPLIAKVYQLAFESRAVDLAAAQLLRPGGEVPKRLQARLAGLPPSGTLKEAVQKEKEFLLQWSRPQLQGASKDQAYTLLRGMYPEAEVEAIFKAAGDEVGGLLRLCDESAQQYEELGEIMLLPVAPFRSAIARFREQHEVANPTLTPLLRVMENVRFAQARRDVRFTMLDAAMRAAQGDVDRLKAIQDPFGDGPFVYRPFKGGFKLTSRLKRTGQPPVSLVAGTEGSVRRSVNRVLDLLGRALGR